MPAQITVMAEDMPIPAAIPAAVIPVEAMVVVGAAEVDVVVGAAAVRPVLKLVLKSQDYVGTACRA